MRSFRCKDQQPYPEPHENTVISWAEGDHNYEGFLVINVTMPGTS